MRIGGSVLLPYSNTREWLAHVQTLRYSCVPFPVSSDAARETIHEYLSCIRDNGLVIGEVGVWRNLLAADPEERENVVQYSIRQLEMAEEVGANCCVNISGSTVPLWDGYGPDNYSPATYDTIVEQTRRIIDAVQPRHTCYSLEPMPWMLPDSPESYLQLIHDVDRPAFAVHLDYVNMINSMDRYRNSKAFIFRCFELLSPWIRSVHMKDVLLKQGALPLAMEEVPVGKGTIELGSVLQLVEKLGPDTPVFVEHLKTHEEYMESIRYLRGIAPDYSVRIL